MTTETQLYAPFYEKQEPDFINEAGFKWWLDKSFTLQARQPNINGTTLNYQIFVVEKPNGFVTRVILNDKREPIDESTDSCYIYDKIEMAKLIKERCSE